MTKPFTQTALRLFQAVGYPENVPRRDDDEAYHVWMATNRLSDQFWNSLGEEKYDSVYWPITAATLDALRAALIENRENYAGTAIARAMVRGNCLEPDVMARLDGWDRMMFVWKKEGITPELAVTAIQEAGLHASSVDIEALNGWLLNPLTALDKSWDLARALFEDELVYAPRKSSDFAEHEVLLGELLAKAKPPVVVNELVQRPNVPHQLLPVASPGKPQQQHTIQGYPVYRDAAEHFIVSFEFEAEKHRFTTNFASSYLDRDSVLRFFDQFMLKVGRSERVFDLQVNADYGFVVVSPEAGLRLASQLYVPLRACASTPNSP